MEQFCPKFNACKFPGFVKLVIALISPDLVLSVFSAASRNRLVRNPPNHTWSARRGPLSCAKSLKFTSLRVIAQ